jgi:hypothetical protein
VQCWLFGWALVLGFREKRFCFKKEKWEEKEGKSSHEMMVQFKQTKI